MEEVWKDVKNYEGIYQVSNTGKVRRLTFTNNQVTKEKIHEIKPTDNGHGYLIVGLKNGGERKSYYLHRLVAEAFCEKNENCTVVNHIDHNKYNNSANNLEWCTQKENVLHSAARMRHEKRKCKPTNTGEKYISKTISGFYRVCIRNSEQDIYRIFRNFEDAVEFRNEVINGGV